MSKDAKNVPALRFKGFSDAWEKRKLGDVTTIFAGGDVDKSKLSDTGKYPVIANALTNEGIVGYYEDYRVHAPAVTVTGRGDVGHAKARQISYTPIVRLLTVQSKAFDSNFLASLINNTNILVESTGVPQLTSPQLGSYRISFPPLEEQLKIGRLILQFDNLIAATQHKIEKLELAKEATLQHMFNKSWKISGNFPSWKDAELGSLNLDISDGDWIESEHIHRTGSYRIIQTGNIGLGIFVDKSETAKYIHQSDYDELHANEVFPGDILICRLAEPAGRAIILPDIHHRMVTVVDVAVIRPSSQISAYFLVSELNRPKVLHEVGTLTSGSTRKRISRKNLEKVNLEMPSVDEQTKIAIIVESFSKIISLTQSNLTTLKTLKAFLMQNLFV